MAEVLSQQEIDELLKALSSGEVNVNEIKEKTHEKKVKTYDFRRPNKFAKDQLRTLEIIYENFSRLLASYLSGILRSYCQVDMVLVEPQTYYEFNNSLPEPVLLGIVEFRPLKGSIIIEFSPGIVYAIIDRLLGGPGKLVDKIREFTEIETVLIERIIKQILSLMDESWSNVIQTDLRLDRIETNAQFAQIASPNETIAIITLNVKIGDVEGMINLCIPYVVIEPVATQLSTKYWFSAKMVDQDGEKKSDLLARRIENTKLEIKAVLGQTYITVKDFLGLQQGDVIRLDKKVDDDITVMIGNQRKFLGIVGVKNRNLAIQITDKERGELKTYE